MDAERQTWTEFYSGRSRPLAGVNVHIGPLSSLDKARQAMRDLQTLGATLVRNVDSPRLEIILVDIECCPSNHHIQLLDENVDSASYGLEPLRYVLNRFCRLTRGSDRGSQSRRSKRRMVLDYRWVEDCLRERRYIGAKDDYMGREILGFLPGPQAKSESAPAHIRDQINTSLSTSIRSLPIPPRPSVCETNSTTPPPPPSQRSNFVPTRHLAERISAGPLDEEPNPRRLAACSSTFVGDLDPLLAAPIGPKLDSTQPCLDTPRRKAIDPRLRPAPATPSADSRRTASTEKPPLSQPIEQPPSPPLTVDLPTSRSSSRAPSQLQEEDHPSILVGEGVVLPFRSRTPASTRALFEDDESQGGLDDIDSCIGTHRRQIQTPPGSMGGSTLPSNNPLKRPRSPSVSDEEQLHRQPSSGPGAGAQVTSGTLREENIAQRTPAITSTPRAAETCHPEPAQKAASSKYSALTPLAQTTQGIFVYDLKLPMSFCTLGSEIVVKLVASLIEREGGVMASLESATFIIVAEELKPEHVDLCSSLGPARAAVSYTWIQESFDQGRRLDWTPYRLFL